MDYDEDGDPILPPPESLRLPALDTENEVFVTGIRVERVENKGVTRWGVPTPAVHATFQTTRGPLRTFWTRGEAAALAEGIRSVLCDG